MAFGYGPGSDMMKEYQRNRKELGRSKSLKDVTDIYAAKGTNKELIFKKMSPEKLEEFKQKLKEEKRAEMMKKTAILGVVAIAIIIFAFLILL